jgi:hypothetical protein
MLVVESTVIGLITGIIGSLISLMLMYITDKTFSIKKYTFAGSVFFSFFLTGVVIHTFFEMVGLNTWYCKNGVACLK